MIKAKAFQNDNQEKSAKQPEARLFGRRGFVIIAIAFILVAIVPTMAQNFPSVELRETDPKHSYGSAERADENFAGSAFYFMEQNYSVIPTSEFEAGGLTDPSSIIGSDASLQQTVAVGSKANPLISRAGTVAHSRALKCLTDAIYYESANEPDSGQRGVAQVIINRMRHPTYPNSICGVIYQGSERRTGCQFSYSCDGSMARKPNRALWNRANAVAADALNGYVHKPVGMATHYHATYVYPYWAPSLDFIGTIGAHRFYKWKGSAGKPSAFFRRYAGNEPFPGPKPRKWSPTAKPAKMLDPIQLQKKYEAEYEASKLRAQQNSANATANYNSGAGYNAAQKQAQPAAPKYSAPDYSAAARKKGGDKAYAAQRLPQSNNVKPEFQASGTWKKQPTG